MNEVSDFHLTMRLRNNQLRARRLALGLSAPAFAKKVGMGYQLYLDLEGLRKDPISKRKDQIWLPSVMRLAEFYGEPPETLFPTAILAVQKPESAAELDGEKLAALAGYAASAEPELLPSELLEEKETTERVRRVLRALRPIEAAILRARANGETLASVGQKYGKSVERMRQLEERAMRRARKEWRAEADDVEIQPPDLPSHMWQWS